MRRTSWICGSVCKVKFLGEPPPTRTTPVFCLRSFASSTMAVVSFTSMLGFTRSLLPRSSTPAMFMPMVESPGDEQKQGTPAR